MKWVPDRTGRFPKRPHYDPDELEFECQQIVESLGELRRGAISFPLTTDDLSVLLEARVGDLDMYADLSQEEGEVEGVTEFRVGQRPSTKISKELSTHPSMENRLRTTLTHELGHVHFHRFMFELQPSGKPLFVVRNDSAVKKCKRESIVGAREVDWMEWQAGFASGAILMPATELRRVVQAYAVQATLSGGKVPESTPEALALTDYVAATFRVSKDAARVRLLQRGYLGNKDLGGSLF